MIIDGHAYVFPPLDSAAGLESVEEKMRLIQTEFGGHHQPVWRSRDLAPSDNSVLMDQQTGELTAVTWSRRHGQLVWQYEGETYTKQYVPPMLHNLESTPEFLIREMDYIGIEKAVLHNSAHLGRINNYLQEATQRFPDRLYRLIGLREAEIAGDPEAAATQVEAEVEAGGCVGIQFFNKLYYDSGHTEPWDGSTMRRFWDAVTRLGLPIYVTLMAVEGDRYSASEQESYFNEQAVLIRWMERYPDVDVVVTHGLPWRSFIDGSRIVFPDRIWQIFDSPRCHLQLLLPIQIGGIWEYPWKEVEPTVHECVERVGADRLIWGTDMPMVARFCTYRQTMDQYRVHCNFLSENARKDILGGTVARLMGLQ